MTGLMQTRPPCYIHAAGRRLLLRRLSSEGRFLVEAPPWASAAGPAPPPWQSTWQPDLRGRRALGVLVWSTAIPQRAACGDHGELDGVRRCRLRRLRATRV